MARSCRRQVLHVLHDRGRGGPARRNAFALARAAALEDSPEDSPEARAPQSVQSVPREQSVYSAPGPPSSQPPSLAYRHVSVQSPAAGGGGDGDGGGGGGRGRGGGGGDGDGGGGGGDGDGGGGGGRGQGGGGGDGDGGGGEGGDGSGDGDGDGAGDGAEPGGPTEPSDRRWQLFKQSRYQSITVATPSKMA